MRKLSGIFEGILGDVAKRDIMGKTRKQDDINRLGIKEFEEYFRNHYERIYGGTDIEIQKITSGEYPYEIITIPVIIFDYFEPGKQEWMIYGEFDEKDKLYSVFFIINKDDFERICNDLSSGLPAEISARQKQYEYYRDQLLTFREKQA